MQLHLHPELLNQIAAHYALGTLRGGARRRFETMARELAPVRAAALIWQARLSGMAELAPAVQPAPAVWTRIDNLVAAQRQEAAQAAVRQQAAAQPNADTKGWLASLLFWRGASLAGALATVLALVTLVNVKDHFGTEVRGLQAKLQATEQIEYVAVMADNKASASMLVTFDAKTRRLTLQRVSDFAEGADRSLQLWALPPGAAPRSLGVLGSDKLLKLTAADRDIQGIPTLAISLEPKGGVPGEGGPTGPVVFTGKLIQKQM